MADHKIKAYTHQVHQRPEVIVHENPAYYREGQISDEEYLQSHGVNYDAVQDPGFLTGSVHQAYVRAKTDPHGFRQEINSKYSGLVDLHLGHGSEMDMAIDQRCHNPEQKQFITQAMMNSQISLPGFTEGHHPQHQQQPGDVHQQHPQRISTGSGTFDRIATSEQPRAVNQPFVQPQAGSNDPVHRAAMNPQMYNPNVAQTQQPTVDASRMIRNREKLRASFSQNQDNSFQNKQKSVVSKNMYKGLKKKVARPPQ